MTRDDSALNDRMIFGVGARRTGHLVTLGYSKTESRLLHPGRTAWRAP